MITCVAGVAQLVEHLIRNEGVVGSSPITGTIPLCQGFGEQVKKQNEHENYNYY